MSNTPVLTICIPTYNRCQELENLLLSIVRQIDETKFHRIEIAVSDNASTDDTDQMISSLKNKYPNIRLEYYRNSSNLGADMNYLKAVEIAHGEYAWLMGSDDELNDQAIEKALFSIESKDTIYICGRDTFLGNFNSPKIRTQFFFKDYYVSHGYTFKFKDSEDWDRYFSSCTGLGATMSYLSGIILRKEEWDKITIDPSYIGTAYIHVFILFSMLLQSNDSSLKVLPYSLVKTRFGNDSFATSAYRRIMIDLKGYEKLSTLFNDETVRQSLYDVVRKEDPVVNVQAVLKANKEQFYELIRIMKKLGYAEDYIKVLKRMRSHKVLTALLYSDRVIDRIFRRP